MKRNLLTFFIILLILAVVGTGIAKNLSETGSAADVPDIIKQTNGGEKWETKIDYADLDNWLAVTDAGKDVDKIQHLLMENT